MFTKTLALASLLTLTSVSAQTEYWVDATNGLDTNTGTAASPLKSVGAALLLAGTGDTIFLHAGTYSSQATGEVFPLQVGSSVTQDDLTIRGLGDVRIDFGGITGTGLRVGLLCNRLRLTNVGFFNMDKTDWWTTAVQAGSYNGPGSSADVELDRCRFVDVNRGIVLWQGVPITGWRIHDNLFVDCGNDCINEFDTSSANELFDNTFVDGAHLAILSDADQTVVANNIFSGMRVGVASGATPSAATARVHSNAFWNNSIDVEGAAFPGGTLPPANYPVDPQFVNPTMDDFHLQSTSPLIDAGDPTLFVRGDLDNVSGAVDSDFDGTVRTDVGCYESTPISLAMSGTSGATLTWSVSSSSAQVPVTGLWFSQDDGLIQIPGFSPLLIDPNSLIGPAFLGTAPFTGSVPLPTIPAGVRVVAQAFGFDPNSNTLVGGPAGRVQF